MGLKRGIPDFVFVSPVGKHCWLELKRGNAPLTDAQAAFANMCWERGISHHVVRSYEEAVDALQGWGVLPWATLDTWEPLGVAVARVVSKLKVEP